MSSCKNAAAPRRIDETRIHRRPVPEWRVSTSALIEELEAHAEALESDDETPKRILRDAIDVLGDLFPETTKPDRAAIPRRR